MTEVKEINLKGTFLSFHKLNFMALVLRFWFSSHHASKLFSIKACWSVLLGRKCDVYYTKIFADMSSVLYYTEKFKIYSQSKIFVKKLTIFTCQIWINHAVMWPPPPPPPSDTHKMNLSNNHILSTSIL